MDTNQIATRLVELCRKGDFEAAQRELFAEDVISVEPRPTPAFQQETKGKQANLEKGRQFHDMVEQVHNIEVTEPMVAGNAIAFRLMMDITMKGKERAGFQEICVYEVRDGKIVSERFYD